MDDEFPVESAVMEEFQTQSVELVRALIATPPLRGEPLATCPCSTLVPQLQLSMGRKLTW